MTINRKLGFDRCVPNADRWVVNTEENCAECWVADHHKFTVILWCPRMARCSPMIQKQQDWYKDEILRLNREAKESNLNHPVLFGSFTGWRSQKMVDLYNYVLQNDETPLPNFLDQMEQNGQLRIQVKRDGAPLNEKES